MAKLIDSLIKLIVQLVPFIIVFGVPIAIYIYVKISKFNKTDYALITHNKFFQTIYNKGLFGEYLIYINLKDIKSTHKFLFNVYVPKGDKTTEIDVLLIHKSGIYVFESKNHSGWIFGNELKPKWYQTLPNGRNVRKESFYNPIMQNKTHIKYLKEYLSEYENINYFSIITFSDRCTLKNIEKVSDTPVIHRNNVYDTVARISMNTLDSLSDNQINEIYSKLYPLTQISKEQKEHHIKNINTEFGNTVQNTSIINDVINDEIACPLCGKTMVKRVAKQGKNAGNEFYGCTGFPGCKSILPINTKHD